MNFDLKESSVAGAAESEAGAKLLGLPRVTAINETAATAATTSNTEMTSEFLRIANTFR